MANEYGVGAYGVGPYGSADSDEPTTDYGFGDEPFGSGPFGGVETTDDGDGGLTDDSSIDRLPETGYFGGGRFGQGLFGFENEQMTAIREAWDSGGIELHPSSNAYGLESALSTPLAFISDDLVEINKAHHIDTAVDGELDKIGALVAVHRRDGETDPEYRKRIKVAFQTAIADTTHEAVLSFIANLIQTDVTRIDIDWLPSVGGTAKVSVYQEDIDAALLSADDLADFATQVVPAGHRIIVTVRGTFRFSSESVSVPPEDGFSDDEFEGGTLSESIT